MRFNSFTAEDQPESATGILTAVEALERLKNAIPVLRIDTGAVIRHAEQPIGVIPRDRDMYLAIRPIAVFLSIIKEVAEDFDQLFRIAMKRGKRVVRYGNFRACLLDGLTEDVIHVDTQEITAIGRSCYAVHHATDQRLNSGSPLADVTAELFCSWEEYWIEEEPLPRWFVDAFSEGELGAMKEFNGVLNDVAAAMPKKYLPIAEFVLTPLSARLAEAAKLLLRAFEERE